MRHLMICWMMTGCLLAGSARAASDPDEDVLRAARLGTDGPSLLDFFRQRTLDAGRQNKLAMMIRDLGHDSFEVREAASAGLLALGGPSVPLLTQALDSTDLEVAHRAEHTLRQIHQGGWATQVPAAAARLVARHRPAGAAAVLLDYLPSAGSDFLADEIREALAAVAVQADRPDPAVLAALADREPRRREAAAVVLCRVGDPDPAAVRRLFADPDEMVRLRVARARAALGDREAVPVLIDLLGRLPLGAGRLAEDALVRLAGERAPAAALGADEAARRKSAAAWAAWWKDHQGQFDQKKLALEPPLRGFTMILQLDEGRLLELGLDGKPHWQIDGLDFPLDAQYLPGDRVLVAEMGKHRVTERNLKGEIVWEKAVSEPLAAQRLANGNTFIASRSTLVEVDRTGQEIATVTPPDGLPIMKAQKLDNGDIACVTAGRRYYRMDVRGRQLQSFEVEVSTSGGRIDVLPNGHVLVPQRVNNKLVEHDEEGKIVWEIDVEQPVAAVRLRNGNTLVTSLTQKQALELDPTGKTVWEYRGDTRVNRAWRR